MYVFIYETVRLLTEVVSPKWQCCMIESRLSSELFQFLTICIFTGACMIVICTLIASDLIWEGLKLDQGYPSTRPVALLLPSIHPGALPLASTRPAALLLSSIRPVALPLPCTRLVALWVSCPLV